MADEMENAGIEVVALPEAGDEMSVHDRYFPTKPASAGGESGWDAPELSDEDWGALSNHYWEDVEATSQAMYDLEEQQAEVEAWLGDLALDRGIDPDDFLEVVNEFKATVEHGRELQAQEEQAQRHAAW